MKMNTLRKEIITGRYFSRISFSDFAPKLCKPIVQNEPVIG